MISELRHIYFLLRTGFIEKKSEGIGYLFLRLFLLFALFKVLIIGVLFYLDYIDLLNKPENITQDELRNLPKIQKLVLVVICGPIIEELTFRLGLKFSRLNFSVTSGFLTFLFIRWIFDIEILFAIPISTIIGLTSYVSLEKIRIEQLSIFWEHNKRLILYLSIFAFAFIHLRNYEITLSLVLLSPVHILSHAVAGIFYSYARFRIGILAAIFLHAINNGFMPALGFIIDVFK